MKHARASKLIGQECITKLILGLWDHMNRIWTYHNNRYCENINQNGTRYKTEALDRRYEEIREKHAGLVEMLHAFQTKHFEDRQSIGNLNYESKCCWANLADQYIIEAASPIRSEMYTLSESALNWSRSSSLSGVLWLPFCLFWFKQISVAQAKLK
jgi:hypothetical protein